jgi:hypothetical protein
VDRIPVAVRLTQSKQEEDYPSVASDAHGNVWLAYVQFRHSPDYLKLRNAPRLDPEDYTQYKAPTGGDQIWVEKYSQGKWGEPIAATGQGGDLYRTAIAVDGRGRAWVFWSENHGGNFDIMARAIDGLSAQEKVPITKEEGADIDPVATTDASGRVWVVWQGWRNGRAGIFVARQEGRGFSAPVKISNSASNEWNPALTADKSGRVGVAWDSYRNGNYDVYARIWVPDSWGAEISVAASARYEAYPSIAFDPTGRLWVAYEEGGWGWGKDFGAYSTTGVALYQGRAVRLRGIEPDGHRVGLDVSPDTKLAGTPSLRVDRPGSQSDAGSFDPNPENALHRRSGETVVDNAQSAKNTLPRLAVDGSGRIWLAFRTAHPIWWNPVGTVWTEEVISFDGKQWAGPIFLNHSDNLLDNRPALLCTAPGKLLVVNSSDGRRNFQVVEKLSDDFQLSPNAAEDPYNNDLWSDEIDLGPGHRVTSVISVGSEAKPAPPAGENADDASVKAIRDYRGGPGGNMRIIRGDFHRHSDISYDGDTDGTILDQWRYAIDVAALDWIGCCDHDNGSGREYSWWMTQKLTDVFNASGNFVSMFSYERSVDYPEGHRNVIFAERGIRTLPRLPRSAENPPTHAPDTQMLYRYLRQFHGIAASHTSATSMGTDWRDNDPTSEPVVEIYQGIRQNYEMPDAPRSNSEKDSIGGWRPKGLINLALNKGYKLGFEASSDHVSTHMSYCNLYVKDLTRESILEALQRRNVYAATDNIVADVESGSYLMGDEFSTSEMPTLKIRLDGTSKFAKVVIVRDGKYVYSISPHAQEVEFSWRDFQPNKGKKSYYYVRGEQENGEIVWVSPLWITYTGN